MCVRCVDGCRKNVVTMIHTMYETMCVREPRKNRPDAPPFERITRREDDYEHVSDTYSDIYHDSIHIQLLMTIIL